MEPKTLLLFFTCLAVNSILSSNLLRSIETSSIMRTSVCCHLQRASSFAMMRFNKNCAASSAFLYFCKQMQHNHPKIGWEALTGNTSHAGNMLEHKFRQKIWLNKLVFPFQLLLLWKCCALDKQNQMHVAGLHSKPFVK